ncbi:MAG: hypothetical protein MZV70_11855 [Desulfobacterales bacterium]|nr:hypothetical protein [Desulfobacterales bacterium]
MSADEILEAALSMEQSSLSTIVLQSGEAPGIRDEEIGAIIRRIKKETNLAVTVSVGNRSRKRITIGVNVEWIAIFCVLKRATRSYLAGFTQDARLRSDWPV